MIKCFQLSNCWWVLIKVYKNPSDILLGPDSLLCSCIKWLSILIILMHFCWREQGWCSGESACLPPMWPGLDSTSRCHIRVEFVIGSYPCSERFFSGYSGFPLSSKTNTSKFQLDLECTNTFEWASEPLSVSWVSKLHLHLKITQSLIYLLTFS